VAGVSVLVLLAAGLIYRVYTPGADRQGAQAADTKGPTAGPSNSGSPPAGPPDLTVALPAAKRSPCVLFPDSPYALLGLALKIDAGPAMSTVGDVNVQLTGEGVEGHQPLGTPFVSYRPQLQSVGGTWTMAPATNAKTVPEEPALQYAGFLQFALNGYDDSFLRTTLQLVVIVDPDAKVSEPVETNNTLRLRLPLPSKWPTDKPAFLECTTA